MAECMEGRPNNTGIGSRSRSENAEKTDLAGCLFRIYCDSTTFVSLLHQLLGDRPRLPGEPDTGGLRLTSCGCITENLIPGSVHHARIIESEQRERTKDFLAVARTGSCVFSP